MKEYCCKDFTKAVKAGERGTQSKTTNGVEQDDDGTWNIYSCCSKGAGCLAAYDVKFCPWCGSKLPILKP